MAHKVTIRRLNDKGDVLTVVDTEVADAVTEAEKIISKHIVENGGAVFGRSKPGETPTQIDAFDPEADTIYLVTPFQGGA